jgi:hypothetical protein
VLVFIQKHTICKHTKWCRKNAENKTGFFALILFIIALIAVLFLTGYYLVQIFYLSKWYVETSIG